MKQAYPISVAQRQKAIDDAKSAGLGGALRLPDTVLFANGVDPSDSMIIERLDGLYEGQARRNSEAQAYINLPRLRIEYMRGPPVDALEWIRERFITETMSS